MANPTEPFSHPLYYFHSRPEYEQRRSSRAYQFHLPDGRVVLAARMFAIPKESFIHAPDDPQCRLLTLKAWRFFPFNGKYDVLDCASGEVLGAVKRNGAIYDPRGRKLGRIVDPTPVRRKLALGVFEAIVNALLGQGDTASYGPSADVFQLRVGSHPVAFMRRTRLPFPVTTTSTSKRRGFSLKRFLQRFIPAKVWPGLHAPPSASGWELRFASEADAVLDTRLRLAAALFRVELERRFSG